MSPQIKCLLWKNLKRRALLIAGGIGIIFFGVLFLTGNHASRSVLLFVQAPVSAGSELDSTVPYPDGTRLVALSSDALWSRRRPRLRTLITELTFVGRPVVSYDGRWVLVSGKKNPLEPFQIWKVRTNGATLRPVTRGATDCTDPAYLPNGRIVYSAHPEDGAPESRALYVISEDGASPERITYGDAVDRTRRVLPDGRILFSRRLIENETQTQIGAVVWMTLFPDGTGLQRYDGNEDASLESIVLPSGKAVVAYRPPGETVTGLYEYDANQPGRLLYGSPEFHALHPVVANSVAPPRTLTSLVNPQKTTGAFYCLNVYDSEIPEVRSLSRGELRTVRFFDAQDGHSLGETPIEEDGSFYVEVPANRPLRIEVLNGQGESVARLESGIWVRPNETRGCVGCHEAPDLSPENSTPLAVMKPPAALGISPVERKSK